MRWRRFCGPNVARAARGSLDPVPIDVVAGDAARQSGLIPAAGMSSPGVGALIGLAVIFRFSGLEHVPLANNMALFFIELLLLTLISAFGLCKPASLRQWLAPVIGLAGALIVLRPNWAASVQRRQTS